MADAMVLATQKWLNEKYGNDSRFNKVAEDGITGWGTIYGLRRALQIEEGITSTSNNFGPTTYAKCPTVKKGDTGNLVYIVQGGLWCKGYSPGGFNGTYGDGTYAAVQQFKKDAGFDDANGNIDKDFMKALLDMSAFKLLSGGTTAIRAIQQQLNKDYYDFYQICPCNGLYDRDMNKMLIYALQKEEGIPKSSATGTWGKKTISSCPTLELGKSSNVVKLVRYALVCNGVSVNTSSKTYDATLDEKAKEFAKSLKLTKPANKINYTIIKSLLSSNGDPNRAAVGCDTSTRLNQAKITTLKEKGYKTVGRYLTKVSGGLDKNMTDEEIKLILDNGLSIFPIFQEYGGGNNAFSKEKGKQNAQSAYQAATNFGIPFGTTIYFVVDYDPQTADINKYIVPYFKGIYEALTSYSKKLTYKVGVYGTRNVCRILQNSESKNLQIDSLFVSDASYGFSGNLGFVMPNDWAFDQFATDIKIGSGEGAVSIDKVALSGKRNGFSYVNKGLTLTPLQKIYKTLEELFKIALTHTNNDVSKSNKLVAQYIREKNPSYKSSKWDLTGGSLDKDYKSKADKVDQSHDYMFNDPLTNEKYDFCHLMATLSAVLHLTEIPNIDLNWERVDPLVDIFAGWGGDLTTFSKDLEKKDNDGKINGNLQSYANNLICKEGNSSSFPLADYIADIDAVIMGYIFDEDEDIASLFYNYYISNGGEISKHRSRMFVSNAYGDLDKFATAVNTFSDGLGVPEVLDVLTYIKEGILGDGESLPSSQYRDAGAKAFINFVTKEYNSMR